MIYCVFWDDGEQQSVRAGLSSQSQPLDSLTSVWSFANVLKIELLSACAHITSYMFVCFSLSQHHQSLIKGHP